MEERRAPFYQGLLQVAVGLFHAERDNFAGAVLSLQAASQKLSRYRPKWEGVNTESLCRDISGYLLQLEEIERFRFTPLQLQTTDPLLAEEAAAWAGRPPLPPEE